MNSDAELEHWTDAAPIWAREADLIAEMTRPVTLALVGQLTPRAGECLLDLACGPGDPALTLAPAVAPRGLIVATDPVHTMVAAATTRAVRTGVQRLSCVQARAQALPYQSASFHALSCRFGAMFFQPRARALAEVVRVLSPGGRAVFAVWGPRDSNPYFTSVHAALDEVQAPAVPQDTDAPTAFELAEAGVLVSELRAAGMGEAREQALPFEMRLPDTAPEAFLDRQAALSPFIARRLALASETQTEGARTLLARSLQRFARDGALAFPAQALLVMGRR